MFERFAPDSRAVMVAAYDLALELGSSHIGAGHVLYGCAEGREDTAAEPLRQAGITPTSVRRLLPRTDERRGARRRRGDVVPERSTPPLIGVFPQR